MRVSLTCRVCGLAAALGLAAAGNALPGVASSFLLLCAIAALASVPQTSETAQRAVPIIEGGMVGLVLDIAGPTNQPLGLYLMVPALLAGLVGGAPIVAGTMLAELAAIAAVPFVRLNAELVPSALGDMLPWLVPAVGMGMLASWIRRLRTDAGRNDRDQYVAAHRLLVQLRLVSRGLSAGLDPVTLSAALLDDCLDLMQSRRGAVLLREAGGASVPLSIRHDDASAGLLGRDAVVVDCAKTGEIAVRLVVLEQGESVRRYAFPLRVGTRAIGAVVIDADLPYEPGALAGLQALLDGRTLALDTALLFDEVRTLATADERGRLAREIHDGIAQEVASLGYLVDDLAAARDEDARAVRLAQVRRELTRIVNDLRLSIFDLRRQVDGSVGLGSIVGDYVRQVGARSGMTVHVSLDEVPQRLRVKVEEELLRIAQEAVTNARKHANATNLWVSCRVHPPGAELTIEDDGVGRGAKRRPDSFGMGVMRERAQRIGAQLEIADRAGGGTSVSVSLPATPTEPGRSDGRPDRPALLSPTLSAGRGGGNGPT